MNDPVLSPRLLAAAKMVREGARLADVGTDHGYLPVYLSCKNKISFALASDIARGPLARAEENIANADMCGKIRTLLAPGLEGAENFEPTDIVIAGMGGEMIVSILDKAAFVRKGDIHLILQPMTKQEFLREYLCAEGFEFLREDLVCERQRIYQLILCRYTGKAYGLSALEKAVGPLNLKREDAALRNILKETVGRCEKILRGQQASGILDSQTLLLLSEARAKLEKLERRECCDGQ